MRWLVDMNLTPRWAPFLSAAGHEAIHWASVGDSTAPDEHICDHARRTGFIVITNDLDFPQIMAHTRAGAPSIVIMRGYPLTPEARGRALLQALRDCHEQLGQGAILTLDWTDRPRARLLPLQP